MRRRNDLLAEVRRITHQTLMEEVSKNDVQDMVNSKLNSREFEKKVREIVADAFSDLFKELFYRDNVWKNSVKK